MAVRQRQLRLRREFYLRQALMEGQIPKSQLLDQAVAHDFEVLPAGQPRTGPMALTNGQISSPATWSTFWSAVRSDLEVGFTELLAQRADQLSLMTFYDTERRRLKRDIDRVSGQITALSAGATLSDHFVDFHQVELAADADRGIPEPTALVNLERHEVVMPPAAWQRLALAGAIVQVKLLTSGVQYDATPAESLFNDQTADPWTVQVTGQGAACQMLVTVQLPQSVRMSRIVLAPHSPGAQQVKLGLVEGAPFIPALTEDPWVWEFAPQDVSRFTLTFDKTEADELNGLDSLWTFGALRLSANLIRYAAEAVFVSTPLAPTDMYGLAQVQVEALQPTGSTVRTFVAQDIPGAALSWREANGGWIDFGLYEDKQITVTPEASGPVTVLPADPIRGSLTVRGALEMWQRERLKPGTMPAAPSLKEWVGQQPIVSFHPVAAAALPVPAGLGRFHLYLTLAEGHDLSFNPAASDGVQWTMSVNGDPVSGGILHLPAGEVVIEVLTVLNGNGDGWLKLTGLYPLELTGEVYGTPSPMNLVSPQELQYATAAGDRTRFALSGRTVQVAYDPTGIAHRITYQSVKPGAKKQALRVMVRLMGDGSQSPRLKSYRVLTR